VSALTEPTSCGYNDIFQTTGEISKQQKEKRKRIDKRHIYPNLGNSCITKPTSCGYNDTFQTTVR
jgi:hypothetical protein